MAENIQPESALPNLHDLTPDQIGGVVNPLDLKPVSLDLPKPPMAYPSGVKSPNLIPTQPSITSSQQVAANLHNMAANVESWATNPYHYAKVKTYNADYDGANFKRYAAVPRLMREYGFTPYRDNESLYNEHATNWEYFKRSAGQSWELMKTGFTEMLPWNAWDGEDADLEAAREMERAHAIGHDSRSGFGSWVNNMTVDVGYTFGILGEFAAEELLGWVGSTLLAPETGGASWAAMGAEATASLAKLRKLWNMGDRVKDMYKGVTKTYDWMRSADKMRDVYNFGKSGLKWTAKQLTPETMKWADDMVRGGFTMRGGELMMDLAKASKGFGAFYRDSRAYAAIVSEAKLEGGSAELQLRDKLIDEYAASHNGEMPGQEELAKIYTQAAAAGESTFWWNVPALYISNKIVFDKALKGFKPAAAFREELQAGIKGKLAFNEAWRAAGTKAWEVVDDSFRSTLKSLTKASTYAPKNLLKNTVGSFTKYAQANLTEGLQEVYQDAVQNTMVDYYSDRYYHPAVEGSRSVAGSFMSNLGETLTSSQGWDTFASGFFMGGMVQMPQKLAFEWVPKKFWQIRDAEGYAKYMTDMENHTNSVVNALNAATMDDKFWDGITENTVQQLNNKVEAERANAAGDKHAFYTIVDEDVFNHMHTLIKSGKLSLIKDHIKDLKKLDEKSLTEAFGPVEESEGSAYDVYQKRLDSMLNKANLVEKHSQSIEKSFPNPFDPSRYNPKKNPTEYAAERNAYEAFERAKKAAMYSSYAFDRSVERMKSVMDDIVNNKPIGEAAASDFTLILDKDNLTSEIAVLENEISTYSKGDATAQAKAKKLQAKLDRLKDYEDAVNHFQTALEISSKERAGIGGKEVEDAKQATKVTKGTRVKNKKGKEAEVAKVKNGIAYDKAGNRIGTVKSLKIISGERKDEMLDAATQDLYEKYYSYLKEIAAEKGTFASDEAIMSSFQKLKDYYNLKQDARDMSDAVDTLHNPSRLAEYASRLVQIQQEGRKQHHDKIKKSYERFLRLRKINDLFNQLYNMGVFLDENGMKAVLDDNIPSDFYSIPTKERISEDDPKYKEILDLFEKFEETEHKTFKQKPIPEEEFETAYATGGRNKINNDRRTYKDHAEYWGFDADPAKITKINSREILQKIIDSPYATRREKMLARRLKAIVSKDSVITFGKRPTPGAFTYSAEGKTGTSIDARYSSSDYRGGRMPIEMVMMHELIHEITSYEMEKDAGFKSAINKLFTAAKDAYQKNPPRDATLYPGADRRPFYGLKNEHEFLAEMFTNDRFAAWLDTIPYESTGKSLWKEFVDQLQKFLKRILGVRDGSSLLDEALYIATSHIDRIHGLAEPVKVGQEQAAVETGTRKVLTPASSIEDLRSAGVLDPIIREYRKFVELQNTATAEGWIDKFVPELTDEQVANSDAFRQYLQMGSGAVGRILQEYNQKGQPKTKAAPTPKTGGVNVGTAPSAELVAKGLRLGFTKEQLNAMTPQERDLIRQASSKDDVQELRNKYPAAIGVEFDLTKKQKYTVNRGTLDLPTAPDIALDLIDWEKSGLDQEHVDAFVSAQLLESRGLNREGVPAGTVRVKNNENQYVVLEVLFKKPSEPAGGAAVSKEYKVGDIIDASIGRITITSLTNDGRFMVEVALPGGGTQTIIQTKQQLDDYKARISRSSVEAAVETELADRPQKKILVDDLGYTWNEANAMTKVEAQRIIDEGMTKAERMEMERAQAEEAAVFAEAQKEFLMEFMEQRIANAHYVEELRAIEDEISEALAVDPLNIDTNRMNAAIEARKQQLAREINFEDIRENEVLIMKDNRKMIVAEKTGNKLKLRKFGETAGAMEIVYQNEVQDKILYKDQPFMRTVDINPPVTPEAQETSNENVKTAQNLNTTEAIEEDRNNARAMTQQEVDDEFNNSIGCE